MLTKLAKLKSVSTLNMFHLKNSSRVGSSRVDAESFLIRVGLASSRVGSSRVDASRVGSRFRDALPF